jgi:hypothetical protein
MPKPPYIRNSDGTVAEGSRAWARDWTLTIELHDLTYIRINHQTRFQFQDTEVVVESPFVLTIADTDYALDPGEREKLGPLLGLYPDTLGSASVDDDGTLRLTFASGAAVVVPPNPHYEAWQVVGPGSALVVCEPGGEGRLSVWS